MSNIQIILRDPLFIEAGIAMHRHYDSGVSIIEEGSGEREVYVIESGCVRVHERIELEDRRHIQPGICDLGAGEVFGELSLYESGPRLATIVTVEPTEVLVFDASALVDYLDSHPEFGYQVLKELFKILTCRLRQTDCRLGSLFAWGLKAHGIDRHL
jgi:CRP/FNR family cyclic AMP-dependent transcriptional regulator